MKKLWINALLSALFISISLFVYAERREKEVKIEDLPQNIQEFISTHFAEEMISSARIVKYGYHKVMLSNGDEVLFDRKGRWLEIDNKTLPFGFAKWQGMDDADAQRNRDHQAGGRSGARPRADLWAGAWLFCVHGGKKARGRVGHRGGSERRCHRTF
mgnify:CR=1 FL=1